MVRNSDRKFPFAAAPGWNDKGMKKSKPEIQALIIPYLFAVFFFFFFAPSLNTKKDQVLSSATGAVIPSEFRDIYQSPCKQDLIGIKSYVAKKSFSQQAKHGDGLDYLRYRGMLLS